MNDGSGRTNDVLLTYVQPLSATVAGPYNYDARVAVVARGTNDELEKLFVYDGTFLKDQTTGQVLVADLDRGEPFEAVYSAETVTVYGNIRTEVVLYAPQATRLIVNGIPLPFARSGEFITFKDSTKRIYLPHIAGAGNVKSSCLNHNEAAEKTTLAILAAMRMTYPPDSGRE